MSHVHTYRNPLVQWIVDVDNKIPVIFIAAVLGAVHFTLAERAGYHYHHVLHAEWLHNLVNHKLMWNFFSYLGAEITIISLLKAGKFVGAATIGGVLVPPLVVYALTGSVPIALGACATDVAFSIGGHKLIGLRLTLLLGALMMLAVGDDIMGVAILAYNYVEGFNFNTFVMFAGLMVVFYLVGERGYLDFVRDRTRRLADGSKEVVEHVHDRVHLTLESVLAWVVLSFVSTAFLANAGVEALLGGCLTFILAPNTVKEKLIHIFKPIVPLVLAVFGFVNASIDLGNPQSWGWITFAACFGGFGGKLIGITAGGVLGRKLCKENDLYRHVPNGQIFGLATLGAVNGTVAIFFVAMGASKGVIPPVEAAQATLGYFLTVPLMYVVVLFMRTFNIVQESPYFQPEEGDTLDEPAPTGATA